MCVRARARALRVCGVPGVRVVRACAYTSAASGGAVVQLEMAENETNARLIGVVFGRKEGIGSLVLTLSSTSAEERVSEKKGKGGTIEPRSSLL